MMEIAELVLAQSRVLRAYDGDDNAELVEAKMLLLVKTKAVERMFAARGPKRSKPDAEA